MKLEKIWLHDVLKNLCKKVLAPKDINVEMVAALENDTLALMTVQKWEAKYSRRTESLENNLWSGDPVNVITEENRDCV